MACGADCSKIAFIEADGYLNPEMLEDAIRQSNSKYVVLDPLQAFLTEKQDITRTNNIRPILRDLGGAAARTGAIFRQGGQIYNQRQRRGRFPWRVRRFRRGFTLHQSYTSALYKSRIAVQNKSDNIKPFS